MKLFLSVFNLFAGVILLGMVQSFAYAEASNTLCEDGHNKLCSTLPADLDGHPPGIGYIPNTNASSGNGFSQSYVDYFAWQAFVALNWPADAHGKPLTTKSIVNDVSSPRVWSFYQTKEQVFGGKAKGKLGQLRARAVKICGPSKGKLLLFRSAKFELSSFIEAFTPYPLIDRDGNFTLYDIRVNNAYVHYIKSNGLQTKAGQVKFAKHYHFPGGSGNTPGAIEMKTAWRVLTDPADYKNFYTMDARIAVPAEDSATGHDLCIDTKVGLVGMHLVQKFTNPSNFAEYWSWATFEHVANAPLADNAPVSQLDAASSIKPPSLKPTSCSLKPNAADTTKYSFYNPKCTENGAPCATNKPPLPLKGEKVYKWAAKPPYAKAYLTSKRYGTQVIRCWDPYPSAKHVSKIFQAALSGSVWKNYMLVGAQWASASNTGSGPLTQLKPFPAPIYLANTAMETYVQTNSVIGQRGLRAKHFAPGSCITCHNMAKDAAGNNSNLSFLPFSAK